MSCDSIRQDKSEVLDQTLTVFCTSCLSSYNLGVSGLRALEYQQNQDHNNKTNTTTLHKTHTNSQHHLLLLQGQALNNLIASSSHHLAYIRPLHCLSLLAISTKTAMTQRPREIRLVHSVMGWDRVFTLAWKGVSAC
ncbi:hypothetical protein EYC84_006923 [Monilinia fructicola]|uniref:Uncharacterized protein n=1 Tax=Monilinia fructicola TaxID=38448 RepID=A0A5M9K8Y7_MONFR|nr:hypothetical protein EYC84_006923 [Monilinia fructicola]